MLLPSSWSIHCNAECGRKLSLARSIPRLKLIKVWEDTKKIKVIFSNAWHLHGASLMVLHRTSITREYPDDKQAYYHFIQRLCLAALCAVEHPTQYDRSCVGFQMDFNYWRWPQYIYSEAYSDDSSTQPYLHKAVQQHTTSSIQKLLELQYSKQSQTQLHPQSIPLFIFSITGEVSSARTKHFKTFKIVKPS